jgi:phosphatidylinositol alpha-1,6-mannosyltransferase
MNAEIPVLAVTNAWPPMAAGSGRAFASLLAGLQSCTVLAPRLIESANSDARVQPLLRWSGRAGGPLKLWTALQHLEITCAPSMWLARFRSSRPAVLIASQPIFAGLGCFVASRLFGRPYIVVGYGEEFSQAAHRGTRSWAFLLIRLVVRNARMVICTAKHTAVLVEHHFGVPAARLAVVYPSVSADEFGTGTLSETVADARNTSRPRVIAVGRIDQVRKGFDRSIDAWPRILGMVDAELVIIGPGDQGPLRERVERLGVGHRVRFTGSIDREELGRYLRSAQVLLMPARQTPDHDIEGLGMVYLEAALFGVPSIAGDSGGAPEAVLHERTGLVVDGNSPDAIADAVVRLLRDAPLRSMLGEAARVRVAEEFSPERVQRQIATLLASIARAGTRG